MVGYPFHGTGTPKHLFQVNITKTPNVSGGHRTAYNCQGRIKDSHRKGRQSSGWGGGKFVRFSENCMKIKKIGLGWGAPLGSANDCLQSCLANSSWIYLILLIKVIQYKIGKPRIRIRKRVCCGKQNTKDNCIDFWTIDFEIEWLNQYFGEAIVTPILDFWWRLHTLQAFAKFCLFRWVLQLWPTRKYVLNHTKMTNTFDTK